MPDVVDPAVLEALLRQKGLYATGGNIRLSPFATDPNVATNTGAGTPPSSSASSATANALSANSGGGLTVPDANGNPVVLDPNATQLPANIPDESFINILPALAGAGGAALALLIKNHFANKGVNLPAVADPIPTVNATLEPDSVPSTNPIVDGEFEEVNDPRLMKGANDLNTPPESPLLQEQRRLPSPPPTLDDKAVDTKPKNLTAAALRARKVEGRRKGIVGSEGTGPTLVGNDSYADLTPDEMKQAKTSADSLIDRRMQGRQRRYVQGKTDVGRKGLPTAPIDRESALNIVVRAIRDAKLNPNAVRKAVAR